MIRRALPQGRKISVCVVGAGVAGMRCAQMLGAKGIDVTVLEARDRTGGRVGAPRDVRVPLTDMILPFKMHQSMLGGHPVDHGPNWIHGVNQNPILDLAKEVGASTLSPPESAPSIFDHTGQSLSREECKQCSGLMWGIIEEAFEYSDKNSASIPQDQSLLDFFKLKLKEKGLPEHVTERVLQACRSWGDYIGGSVEKQSLKYFWLEETIDGASTYKAILDRITKDTYAHAKVELSTQVVSVKTQDCESKMWSDGPSSHVQVTTLKDFTNKHYDEVVMTAPLGWLKNRTAVFLPSLPDRLLTAIENLSYGQLEKVYLTFPSAFWLSPTDSTSPENNDPNNNDLNPFFTQWLAPSYTPNHWPVECVSLSSLPTPHAQPTLLFYMHGPLAAHTTSLTSTHTPSTPAYIAAFANLFKPYIARLPNYSPSSPSCVPVDALATDWSHDEFAGWGSYSNFQTSEKGVVELDRDIEALRWGAPERGLWFAGEHTAPFVALGTVTGAWWSGEKVARRILRAYGLDGEEEQEKEVIEEAGGKAEGREKVGAKRGGTGLGA
ncbi:MAG: hypothetical protein Q9208_007695 [Pyrenodesmia sp. 3 TL-2023]